MVRRYTRKEDASRINHHKSNSGKRIRAQSEASNAKLQAKRLEKEQAKALAALKREAGKHLLVNRDALAPTTSWKWPTFVERGYYLPIAFRCVGCSRDEVWQETQQKWWYEVMKGDVSTTARRCRSCRRKERERKTNARRVHLEGLPKKGRKSPSAKATDSR